MVAVMKTEAIRGEWIGRVIDGRFKLLQWLGGTETNGVFLTETPGDQPQKAAVRLIPANQKDADAQLALWQSAVSLSHPHLMRLLFCGRCQVLGNPMIYAVTEFSEEKLSEVLPERALTHAETREMIGPVLDALSYLHEKGFVHAHLKPSKIMVVNDQVKLACDGIQTAGKMGRLVPEAGFYDAPECAIGVLSPAADVWSFGVTLVEALTQHPPVFDRATQADPELPKSLPQPFAAIAREALRTDPARRCTLGEIRERLNAPPISQSAAVPQPTAVAPARSRKPAAVIVVVAAIMLIAILVTRTHHRQDSPAAAVQQSAAAVAKPSAASPAPGKRSAKPAAAALVNNAEVVEEVQPDVTPKAMASIHGQFVVKLRVSVDATGAVSSAEFESHGPSNYFANAAQEAARKWKFKPAMVKGEAVPSAWVLQFRFTREGTEITPMKAAR